MNDLKFTTAGDYMKKPPMLERFAAQSLIDHGGELIFSKEKFAELIVRECIRIDRENPDAAPGDKISKHFGVNHEI